MNAKTLAKSNNLIHPTAIIYEGAEIGDNVQIGPYSIIYSGVKIGDGTIIHPHVVIQGNTTIGKNNKIYSFCCIGSSPQDLKYKGEDSVVIIGDNNIIREYTTVNPGTASGGMVTSVGSNCLIMMNCHIAHDCKLGDNIIMANHATLAGHVIVEDYAVIGGLVGIHQFVRVGKHSMIGFLSAVDSDVIPYGVIKGERAKLNGINLVGLKRRNFSKSDIMALLKMYDELFENSQSKSTIEDRIQNLSSEANPVKEVVEFINSSSERGICKPN